MRAESKGSNIADKIKQLDWQSLAVSLHEKGYVIIPRVMPESDCTALRSLYERTDIFRKTVVMERYRFGLGEYKYFDYPLPEYIQTLRQTFYPYLAAVANHWMTWLRLPTQFPATLLGLKKLCRANNQTKATPLLLKYGSGGFNTLHQDLYGEVFFPLQAAIFLDQPGRDYTGGEFVLTQQTPRAQSRVIVFSPQQGDMIIFASNFRPAKGVRGFYRITMKHGVSDIHSGTRHTLGIIFHDATT